MTTDPAQIRQDIEVTRGELSSDVNALADRVRPQRVVGQRVSRVRTMLYNTRDRIMGTTYHAGEAGREKASTASQQAASKASTASQQVASKASTASQQAASKASTASQQVASKASSASQQVASKASSAKSAAGAAMHAPRERTEGTPLAAGMIAFGLGVVVSSLLPRTRKEQQVAGQAKNKMDEYSGQVRQQVRQQVREAAGGVAQEMRQPAKQAATSVASTAAHSASALREEGREAAHEMQEQARETKEHARHR
jgi:hypothetical protein